MKMKNTRKGFTTVELVIVIAVIAILATVLIPTFSNMIESANLSVDKQNVRNMNVCLQTYIATDGSPEDFGKVKQELQDYGYGKDDNFMTKTNGYSIRWYGDKIVKDNGDIQNISVILLVNDETRKVVYPEEYVDLVLDETVTRDDGTTFERVDVRKYFDLSLPAAIVDPNEGPIPVINVEQTLIGFAQGSQEPVTQELAKYYIFAPEKVGENTKYGMWYADFHIRFEEKSGDEYIPLSDKQRVTELLKDVAVAGYYKGWSLGEVGDKVTNEEDWLFFNLIDTAKNTDAVDILEEKGELPVLLAMAKNQDPDKELENLPRMRYNMLLTEKFLVDGIFKCGVLDPAGGKDADITMYVELRLTNPEVEDGSDYVVVGMYSYTFK